MPDINADGCRIHVEVEGPEQAPVLMLSNSLGTTLHMWDDQVAPITQHFRLVRYDRRGHGKSGVPKSPYSMERLGRDVIGVLDGLGIAKINWCGLSMGGMVGMWLGAIMWFNVWFIIWPNQKKALGIVNATPDEKKKAARLAGLTSRVNTMLSIPMLYGMVFAGHYY